jgi:excisionase family DNA binding protein
MTELLTLDEVAERCRAGRRTVEKWIAAGDLASIKVGKRRLVPVTALEQFLRRAEKRGRVA